MSRWEMVRLGDVCTRITDGAHLTPPLVNSGIPLYNGADINNLKIYNPNPVKFISEETDKSLSLHCKPQGDDVLISSRGSIGKIALVDFNQNFNIMGNIILCRPDQNILFPRYLVYFLTSIQLKLEAVAHGVAQKGLYLSRVREYIIPLPPLDEQRRIAESLDLASSLIEKKKRQIELLDLFAKSLFVEMFGDPVENPMGWEVETIGSICYFVRDGPHLSLNYTDYGIPFISVNNIVNRYWDFSQIRYISEEDFNTYSERCCPKFGDVLYTKGGTTGIAKYVDIDFPFLNWVHIAVLKFHENVNGIFLENMLNTNYCYAQSQQYTRGIANRDLVLGQMKKISLYLPPIELQNKFADRIKFIETQKSLLQSGLEKLEMNYKALMQKYFEDA